MLVDRVLGELRVAFGAYRVPGLFQRAAARRDLGRRAIGAFDEIAGVLDRRVDHLGPDQRIAPARCDGIDVEPLDRVQRIAPVGEMAVAAVAGRVVLDDIAGEHHVLVGHVDHRVAGGMGAAQVHDVDPALAQVDGHRIAEGGGRVGQAGDALMPLEQAREALEFAVPVLLPPFHHHAARGVRHDDLLRTKGAGAQHSHRVVVGQRHVGDRLVGDRADAFDHLVGQARGRLRLDDHHAVVTDDDAGVRIALGGEGIEPFADLGEADFFLGHVPLGRECLGHGLSFSFQWTTPGRRACLAP